MSIIPHRHVWTPPGSIHPDISRLIRGYQASEPVPDTWKWDTGYIPVIGQARSRAHRCFTHFNALFTFFNSL